MALTKPFINTIRAFDGTVGSPIQFNVVGNYASVQNIEINYIIYETATNTEVYSGTQPAYQGGSVLQGPDIYNYFFVIQEGICQNNHSYYIKLTITNSDGESATTQSTPFNCYTRPTLSVVYKNSYGVSYSPLQNYTQFGSSDVDIKVNFEKNDLNSVAKIQSVKVRVYGYVRKTGKLDMVYQGEVKYKEPFAQTIRGLQNTSSEKDTELYYDYTLDVTGETIDGMRLATGIFGLKCSYSEATSGGLVAYNESESGRIKIVYTADTTMDDTLQTMTLKRYSATDGMITLMENMSYGSFVLYDTYNRNGTEYTYYLNMSGDLDEVHYTQDIKCKVLSLFNESFICDSQTMYKVNDELSFNSSEQVQLTTVYNTIGRKYPFVAANSLVGYNQGSKTAILRAITSREGYIDRFAQVQLVKEFNDWLTNKEPKIYKDYNGNIQVIFIVNAVQNQYYKELGNGLASTTFDYVEIGEMSQGGLLPLGMLNNFELIKVSN